MDRPAGVPLPARRQAQASIAVIEGRGIWLELAGPLTNGSLDGLSDRLDRLADLHFAVVVLGVGAVRWVDLNGRDLLGAFTDRVVDDGGAVVIVDPDQWLQPITGGLRRADIRRTPPTDSWWAPA